MTKCSLIFTSKLATLGSLSAGDFSSSKENWIQGGGNRVSVHFAVTLLDCLRTSFCVTTIIKIVNNNTNDKQTSGAALALDEDSPYTNSCLFTLDLLPIYRNAQLRFTHIMYCTVWEECKQTQCPHKIVEGKGLQLWCYITIQQKTS